MNYLKYVLGWAITAALVACGGGGGSPGTTTGTSGAGSTPATGTPTITLALFNSANAPVNTIAVGAGFVVRATVRDAAGALAVNKLVTFALNGGSIATLIPDSALTDSSGVAQIAIAPASISALGAATLSATAQFGTAVATGQLDFAVSASNLSLSAITAGSTNLPSAGNTSLSVNALIGGVSSAGTPVNITFSASCGRINGGGSDFSTTTNGNGVASTVYTAVKADGTLCSGPVTVSASSPGATPSSLALNVAAPVANAMAFISATPAQIFVAGSGAVEQSVVQFRVSAGAVALPNVAVRFNLQINPGGVGLNVSGSGTPVTATTDASGIASVSIFSGTIPGPVRVRAALVSDANVFAESQNLTVSSGPPSQRFMSLSVQTFNIEGWDLDGASTVLTVRLADRQGNAVENGTVVNFTAEGGQVASSCATVQSGGISSCSVNFISQNPRPTGGRVSVLAFTTGTKDYVDANGNNIFDAGDTLTNLGDAYRDDNENAAFDAGEFLVPRGGTTACTAAGWPFPSRLNTCDATLATTVRQQQVLFFSSSDPTLTPTNPISRTLFEFTLASTDNLLLPMPAGTTVAAEAGDTTANALACTVDKVLGTTVANIAPSQDATVSRVTSHSVTMKDCAAGDRLLVTITAPSLLRTTFQYTIP